MKLSARTKRRIKYFFPRLIIFIKINFQGRLYPIRRATARLGFTSERNIKYKLDRKITCKGILPRWRGGDWCYNSVRNSNYNWNNHLTIWQWIFHFGHFIINQIKEIMILFGIPYYKLRVKDKWKELSISDKINLIIAISTSLTAILILITIFGKEN